MARGLGLAIVLTALTGCMPVCPFYRSDTVCSVLMGGQRGDRMRQNVERATEDFPVVGRSTRAEVLLRLGEPDRWSEAEGSFTYRWRLVVGKSLCSAADRKKTYHLSIEFDDRGIVRDVSLDSWLDPYWWW
jgi:hypothetical protein